MPNLQFSAIMRKKICAYFGTSSRPNWLGNIRFLQKSNILHPQAIKFQSWLVRWHLQSKVNTLASEFRHSSSSSFGRSTAQEQRIRLQCSQTHVLIKKSVNNWHFSIMPWATTVLLNSNSASSLSGYSTVDYLAEEQLFPLCAVSPFYYSLQCVHVVHAKNFEFRVLGYKFLF